MINVRVNQKNGKNGLFTDEYINGGIVILRFEGVCVDRKDIKNPDDSKDFLQIGEDLFLNLDGDKSNFISHSCVPNCGIRIGLNKAFLISLHDIEAGAELTFDYSTTSTDKPQDWILPCNCHKHYCRKLVSGFAELPSKQQEKYLKLNVVPDYIKEKLSK